MNRRQPTITVASLVAALVLCAGSAQGQFNPGHDCNFCHSMHSPAPAGNYLLNNAVVETITAA